MKRRILTFLLALVILISCTVPALAASFSDVSSEAYFLYAVNWAVKNNITSGTSSTTFSPAKVVTRGQAVTMLWRSQGSPTVAADNPFKDVKKSDYCYQAVLWAVANNITSGTSSTEFSPNKACTKGQVITFVWRTEGSLGNNGTSKLAASYPSTAYYRDAVAWADIDGYLRNMGSTPFNPDALCPRADLLTWLYRAETGDLSVPQVKAAVTTTQTSTTSSAQAATQSYVLNKNTKKFHLPGCSSIGQMKASNRWDYTGTRQSVIDMGYVPCKKCCP